MSSMPPISPSGKHPLQKASSSDEKRAAQDPSAAPILQHGASNTKVASAIAAGNFGQSLRERFNKWTTQLALMAYRCLVSPKTLSGDVTLQKLKQQPVSDLAAQTSLYQLRVIRLAQALLGTDERRSAYLHSSEGMKKLDRERMHKIQSLGDEPTADQIASVYTSVKHLLTQIVPQGMKVQSQGHILETAALGHIFETAALFLEQCPEARTNDLTILMGQLVRRSPTEGLQWANTCAEEIKQRKSL